MGCGSSCWPRLAGWQQHPAVAEGAAQQHRPPAQWPRRGQLQLQRGASSSVPGLAGCFVGPQCDQAPELQLAATCSRRALAQQACKLKQMSKAHRCIILISF